MRPLTLALRSAISTRMGLYLQSQHIKYWKMFHLHNAKQLSRLTDSPVARGLQKTQIQNRILKLLHQCQVVDLNDFAFQMDLRKELYIDSLGLTVLLTCIEEEFNTILDDDDEIEKVKTMAEVVDILMRDDAIV